MYVVNFCEYLEEFVGVKLVNLFLDMKVEEDIVVFVFVFDKNIMWEKDIDCEIDIGRKRNFLLWIRSN